MILTAILRAMGAHVQAKHFHRTFRYCLSQVKTTAEQRGKSLFIRPVNVGDFKKACDANGLSECDTTQDIIKFLNTHPGEFIEFRYV